MLKTKDTTTKKELVSSALKLIQKIKLDAICDGLRFDDLRRLEEIFETLSSLEKVELLICSKEK